MSDAPTEDQLVAESATQQERSIVVSEPVKPVKVSRVKSEKKFINALTVRTEKDKFRVPVNAEAASAQRQLLAAKLLKVYEQNLDFVTSNSIPLDAKSLNDLTKAGETIAGIIEAAHRDEPAPQSQIGNSAIGNLATQMVKGAVDAAVGATLSMEERLKKIKELGKKQRDAIIVSGEKMEKKAEKLKQIQP